MKFNYNPDYGMSAPWRDLRLSRRLSLRRVELLTGIPKSSLARYERDNYIPDIERYALLIDLYTRQLSSL